MRSGPEKELQVYDNLVIRSVEPRFTLQTGDAGFRYDIESLRQMSLHDSVVRQLGRIQLIERV